MRRRLHISRANSRARPEHSVHSPPAGRADRTTQPAPCAQAYFAAPTCIALVRCIAHAPILPPSIASCACAISFCAVDLPSPSVMASIMDSAFDKFSPLQPAIFAADAGTTAYATAATSGAPQNFLIMFLFLSLFKQPH